jgi:hypothetical protein
VKVAYIILATGVSLCGSGDALAQDSSGTPPAAELDDFSLEPVFPNPFAGETRIAFRLGDGLFEAGQEVRVTLRVYNILHQLVAVPVALDEEGRPGEPIEGLPFRRPGLYQAHWDGRDLEGRTVTAGPYFVELGVGARSQVRKIMLVR